MSLFEGCGVKDGGMKGPQMQKYMHFLMSLFKGCDAQDGCGPLTPNASLPHLVKSAFSLGKLSTTFTDRFRKKVFDIFLKRCGTCHSLWRADRNGSHTSLQDL